jgi:hypothetical protein
LAQGSKAEGLTRGRYKKAHASGEGRVGSRVHDLENVAQSEVANRVAKSSKLRKFRDVSRIFGMQMVWHFVLVLSA